MSTLYANTLVDGEITYRMSDQHNGLEVTKKDGLAANQIFLTKEQIRDIAEIYYSFDWDFHG